MSSLTGKDNLFSSNNYPVDFSFNREVAEVFDDMAARSIPFYHEVLRMSAELCAQIVKEEQYIYDLGCSTGNFAAALVAYTIPSKSFTYIGIDSSKPMLDVAQQRFAQQKNKILFRCEDITLMDFPNAGAIVANYTLQFVKPLERLPLLKKIYESLLPGGCFIMSEKVLESNSAISGLFQKLYYDFKKRNGYSELEIARKREALENVLIPYRLEENLSLLQAAGFTDTQIFFKWYNFASLVAFRNT